MDDFERGGRAPEAPHGQKRRAQDELANDQRLIKRFNLLNLGESPISRPDESQS